MNNLNELYEAIWPVNWNRQSVLPGKLLPEEQHPRKSLMNI